MAVIQQLDGRLAAAAAFVRPGAVFADIGTDHAYLPIFLIQSGHITSAVAADVAEGPLSRARAHIEACGLSDRIRTVLCDGLSGLEAFRPTDIAICGMGGELIASILSAAPWVRSPSIRLILQPMTMQPYLRRYLHTNGFPILEESLALANSRIYPVFLCAYSGEVSELSDADAYFGGSLLRRRASLPLFYDYLAAKRAQLSSIRDGKRKAGLPTDAEDALLDAVSDM